MAKRPGSGRNVLLPRTDGRTPHDGIGALVHRTAAVKAEKLKQDVAYDDNDDDDDDDDVCCSQ